MQDVRRADVGSGHYLVIGNNRVNVCSALQGRIGSMVIFLQGCIGSAAMALQGRIGSMAITLQGRIGSTV